MDMELYVRDNECGATLAESTERILYLLLGVCVHSTRRFIQEHNCRPLQNSTSNRKALQLSS